MPDTDVYIWVCEKGHVSAHSELEIQSMIDHPSCPLRVDEKVCDAKLVKRVYFSEELSKQRII